LFDWELVVVFDQLAEQAGKKTEGQFLEGFHVCDREPLRLGGVCGELVGLEVFGQHG
jgi:hypothetical protein